MENIRQRPLWQIFLSSFLGLALAIPVGLLIWHYLMLFAVLPLSAEFEACTAQDIYVQAMEQIPDFHFHRPVLGIHTQVLKNAANIQYDAAHCDPKHVDADGVTRYKRIEPTIFSDN